jgi:hypothetical protein
MSAILYIFVDVCIRNTSHEMQAVVFDTNRLASVVHSFSPYNWNKVIFKKIKIKQHLYFQIFFDFVGGVFTIL